VECLVGLVECLVDLAECQRHPAHKAGSYVQESLLELKWLS
jgi:hypothetical protein